jgi:phosphocarrier protein FPr
MFPMVATVAEFRAARQLLQTAANEAAGNRPAQNERRSLPIETGAMVEIPAAALCAESLASEVDFFSIGTNDLTQYVLAAERGNARVAYLTDALHPAVLDLIQRTVTAAQRHGKWVGVCGELAGDTAAIPLLVGLGVSELSMAPPLIPLAKETIRSCHSQAARRLAESALRCEDAQSVRRLLSTGSREGE